MTIKIEVAGESLSDIAAKLEVLLSQFGGTTPAPKAPKAEKPKAAPEPDPTPAEEPATAPAAEPAKVEYAQVSTAVLNLVKAKGRDAAVSLFAEFGVANAKELTEDQWPEALARFTAAAE